MVESQKLAVQNASYVLILAVRISTSLKELNLLVKKWNVIMNEYEIQSW